MNPGVEYATKTKIERNGIEATQVKSIKLLTDLDDGAANNNTNTILEKSGIVFNKTYEFKVETYTNDDPEDKSLIKWAVSYTDIETGIFYKNALEDAVTGDTISITFKNQNMCGSNLEVKAYINDLENEGKLTLFKHNRFRFFDRKTFEKELEERTVNKRPWKIDQNYTSLCGMACVFYLFAKEQPETLKKFAKELFRTGEAKCNNYNVKPSIEILDKDPNKTDYPKYWDPTLRKYVKMPYFDFITLAGTRNTSNPKYKGGDEEFAAINWTNVMVNISENLLGYKNVSSNGAYNPIKKVKYYNKKAIFAIIEDINLQLKSGYKLMLMIDSDLINDDPDFYTPKKLKYDEIVKSAKSLFAFEYHWVVLETPITLNDWLDKDGKSFSKANFKVYSWASKSTYLKEPITLEHFINNYYGYIKVK